MNQSIQPQALEQKIIDLVPLLVKLGRTEDTHVLAESMLPNAGDFGVLWKKWDCVVEGWEAVQIADLIKGLTLFERVFNRRFGSVPPVANVFRIYASIADVNDRDDLAEWVLVNTVNEYAPYGTNNHGARSLAELREKEEAMFAMKRFSATREHARFENARSLKVLQATEKLPNALRRKDSKAVAALIAKGADVDAEGSTGQSAREIAKGLGVAAWLTGEATDG